MADYSPQRALANRLIAAKGASFTFSKTATAANPAEPWKGTVPGTTGTLQCVRVEPSSATKLGISTVNEELLARSQHVLICAPGDGSVNPRDFDLVTIGGDPHGITFVEALDPDGSGGIIYFVGAGR